MKRKSTADNQNKRKEAMKQIQEISLAAGLGHDMKNKRPKKA